VALDGGDSLAAIPDPLDQVDPEHREATAAEGESLFEQWQSV
jgi:hypothetical protein